MCATVGALDLCPLSVCVRNPLDRARYLVIEGGPPAPRVELVFGPIEGCLAPPADVRPWLEVALVLAREWHLRSLVNDYPFFFRGQLVHLQWSRSTASCDPLSIKRIWP